MGRGYIIVRTDEDPLARTISVIGPVLGIEVVTYNINKEYS